MTLRDRLIGGVHTAVVALLQPVAICRCAHSRWNKQARSLVPKGLQLARCSGWRQRSGADVDLAVHELHSGRVLSQRYGWLRFRAHLPGFPRELPADTPAALGAR